VDTVVKLQVSMGDVDWTDVAQDRDKGGLLWTL
jgi:hypothetical protein